jgi:predicted site-specific integrase-resolvase
VFSRHVATLATLCAVDRDLVTMKDAAGILQVSWQRVQQLAAEGKLNAIVNERHDRHRVLFRRDDVERLRAERGVGRYART